MFLTLKSELYFKILYLFLINNNKADILIAVCFDNFLCDKFDSYNLQLITERW